MSGGSDSADPGARYRALFESAHDGVLVLHGYRIAECNPRAAEMFARPAAEVVGSTPWDLSPEMQLDGSSSEWAARQLVDDAFAGRPREFEWVHLDAAGNPFIAEVSLSRVELDRDHLVQVILRDVTERFRSRQTERKRLRQLDVVSRIARDVASLHDAGSVLRTAVDEIHTGLEYDTVTILLLDLERGVLHSPAIAGRYAARVGAGFTQGLDRGLIGAAARTARPVLVNDVARDPRFVPAVPDSDVTASELAVPIVVGDRVRGVLDVQEDVVDAFDQVDLQTLETVASLVAASLHNAELLGHLQRELAERRRAEEELRHAQKMEALGRLAGGIAHDFNNLLQAILSTVQLAAIEIGDAQPEATASLRELEGYVQRGASLARQLLLFARRGVTRPERIELDDLVGDAVRLLGRLVRENVRIVHRRADGAVRVDGDRGQLEQVLTNLVLNAADAIEGPGRIELRTGNEDEEHVFVEVADDGHGIEPDVLPRIFEPFFTTKERERGTGLGLSVVDGIVAAHGGRIGVDSVPGRGTTIRVVLPRHDTGRYRAVAPDPDLPPERSGGPGQRILLVEDDPGIRGVMAELLAHLGYHVTVCASAEEALELSGAPPFRLLISDVILPGLSGPELAARLVARWPELAVIMISGYAADDLPTHDVLVGRTRFLQKPVRLDRLSREVRDALREPG